MQLKVWSEAEIDKLELKDINQLIKLYGNQLNKQLKELEQLKTDSRLAQQGIDYLQHRANEAMFGKGGLSGVVDSFDVEPSADLIRARARLKVIMRTFASQKASIEGLRSMREKSYKTFNERHPHFQLTPSQYEDLDAVVDALKQAGWNSDEAVDLFYTNVEYGKFTNIDDLIDWAIHMTTQTSWESDYFDLEA